MRIALAVNADKLTMAKNGGHAPRFAVYDIENGEAKLIEIRNNPRNDAAQNCEHDHNDNHSSDHHHDHHHHDESPEAHRLRQQKKKEMAKSLSDCRAVITHFACPGTRKAFSEFGIAVETFQMADLPAEEILKNLPASLS